MKNKKTPLFKRALCPKKQLINALRELSKSKDKEHAHGVADDLLLMYINDREVRDAYNDIEKWYA